MSSRTVSLLLAGWLSVISALASAEGTVIHILAYQQPPFMESRNNKPLGLAVDVVKLLMERAGFDYDINFVPPKRAYVTAQSSPNHCMLAIERAQTIEALFQWISPILITRHGFYSNASDKYDIRTLQDARPYVIGSYLGSGVGEYLEKYGFNVDFVSSNDLNILKLQRKRVDLWATDTISAARLIYENDLQFKLVHTFLTTLRAMGCHLSLPQEIVGRLQSELMGMYQDGSVETLYQSYLGTHPPQLSDIQE
ncbi:ABC transporter substrate-binding protein [Hahella sp. CCB-MM4]|uniref:substrate-binding periplasmic protein n=1 Tax=Hahella sp. (strain CCB-MM4) TaxID=1926491 RepID=UPI00143CCB98|nr:ABC transporter substrate-binding protein [Hahella sp. CCB-MM4]